VAGLQGGWRTQVTDAGLEHLKGLAKLGYLYIGHSKASSDGVNRLQQVLPDCQISHL